MNLFSKNDSSTVGLDIDGGYLAAVVMDGTTIQQMVSVDLPAGISREGEVTDVDALAGALKDLFTTWKLPKRVRLGVVNQQIVVRHLDMPIIADPTELDAAVRFQAADAIAMPLDDAVLDYQVVGAHESPDGVVRQDVMVVAARSTMIAKLVEAVKAAGLKPEGIDLSAFAVVRVLAEAGAGLHDPTYPAQLVCHLGGVTNFAVAVGDVCVFTRPLQTAWTGHDEEAGSIAEELRISMDFYTAGAGARTVRSVLLCGPGAESEAVREAIATRTGLEVDVAGPLGELGTHTVPSGDDPARYTVAAGLAMGTQA